MISLAELTMGREKQFPQDFTKEVQANLKVLHEKINIIREKYGKPMIVSSGWRPQTVNDATPNAAKASKHIVGLAVDIYDKDGILWKWVIENLQLMQDLGVYLEDKRFTNTWVHFGIGAPKSGKRIFKPSSSAMPYPKLWNGVYDLKYDKV
jgi:uncharacterized protein YcbK (DUF882 family)